MGKDITSWPGTTVGLDLGDRESVICALGADGEVVEQARVRTTTVGLQRWFGARDRCRVVLEVGTHSPWASRLLACCGHEVIVANAAQLPLIYGSKRKNDRRDAERLARVARLDANLLGAVRHRGARAQADLAVLRARLILVRARMQCVNHVRGAVKSCGKRVPSSSPEGFVKRASGEIPEMLRPALGPILGAIEGLSAQIAAYDRQVEAIAESYPEIQSLRQVKGVGAVTAATFVLTIEDPSRFSKSREVGAYVGLAPRQAASGDRDPQLRITKVGSSELRRLLVQCAQFILGPFGPDTDLRRKGLLLAARGGKNARKRAAIAVARKLAVLLHRLWVTGEVYEPLRNAHAMGAADLAISA